VLATSLVLAGRPARRACRPGSPVAQALPLVPPGFGASLRVA